MIALTGHLEMIIDIIRDHIWENLAVDEKLFFCFIFAIPSLYGLKIPLAKSERYRVFSLGSISTSMTHAQKL